jgi:hypothetical protein
MGSYTNRLGQTVVYTATPSGMLPTYDPTDTDQSGNGITVPNTADGQPQPYETAAVVATDTQDTANVHPLYPLYPGAEDAVVAGVDTQSAIAAEIDAVVEDAY